MTRSLSGPYRIDRLDPPRVFYTPSRTIRTGSGIQLAPGGILTVNGSIGTPDRLCVGIVSRQTPFGQGARMGISRSSLRRASRTEILAALRCNHPAGPRFQPPCIETTYLDTVLERAPSNPPDDELQKFAENAHRDDIRAQIRTLKLQYYGVLHRWDAITNNQVAALVAALH